MTNPVLVEFSRGGLLESRHRGAIAIVDAGGATVLAFGDIEARVFPRSTVKALQALLLVESGAADRYGFGDEELALACASHGGEPAHVAVVVRMLAQAGLNETALQCGAHWPSHRPSADVLVRSGRTASALHHNCSGKHAGFLCAARAMGADHQSYCEATHPAQREVRAVLESLSGSTIGDEHVGIDGCSVPTFALPLAALARAFARFGNGYGVAPKRAAASDRLRAACAHKPWHMGGTGQFATQLMQHFGARVLVKAGAEGVCCAALPQQGFGVALKCDDGGARAAEVMMAAVLLRMLGDDAALKNYVRAPVRNWRGMVVGEIRATGQLSERR